MNKLLSFIVVLAVVFAPIYSVASEISLNGQANEVLPDIEYAEYIPPGDGGAIDTPSLLTKVVAGLYNCPGDSGVYNGLSGGIGIAPAKTLNVNYDTEETAEAETGNSTTTWIVIGVLAAVATVVVLAILLSSEGGCGG